MLQQFLPTLAPVRVLRHHTRPTGLVAGTLIRTEDGEMPVEYLLAGDRIETVNNGTVELRGTSLIEARDLDVVLIARTAMGNVAQRPDRDLVIPVSQQVLVHDWRARILHGQEAMLTPASSLVDDLCIRRESRALLRLIRLHFDSPQVIWADGLQVTSARNRAPTVCHGRALH